MLDDERDSEALAKRLKAAVAAGELTEKEARQKWAQLEKARDADARGKTKGSNEKAGGEKKK